MNGLTRFPLSLPGSWRTLSIGNGRCKISGERRPFRVSLQFGPVEWRVGCSVQGRFRCLTVAESTMKHPDHRRHSTHSVAGARVSVSEARSCIGPGFGSVSCTMCTGVGASFMRSAWAPFTGWPRAPSENTAGRGVWLGRHICESVAQMSQGELSEDRNPT